MKILVWTKPIKLRYDNFSWQNHLSGQIVSKYLLKF